MNYFRKMVMLPLDEYNKYRSQMYAIQTTPETNPLQSEMQTVKELYGTNIPDDQLAKIQGEVIQKYSSKNKYEEPPSEQKEDTKWIGDAVSNFTKANKRKATQIINILESRTKKGWNANGELLTSDGEVIKGSNILDLVDFVTSNRKQTKIPNGFGNFIIMLAELNVPQHLFSKHGIEAINNYDPDKPTSDPFIFKGNSQTETKQPSKRQRKANKEWVS